MPRTVRIGTNGDRGCYKFRGVWIPGCRARTNNEADCTCEESVVYTKADVERAIADLRAIDPKEMDDHARAVFCGAVARVIRYTTLGGNGDGPEWWRPNRVSP